MKLLLIPLFVLMGCASKSISTGNEYHQSNEYKKRPSLSGSFVKKTEGNLSDDQIQKLLNSKLVAPQKIKLAIVRLQGQSTNDMSWLKPRMSEQLALNNGLQSALISIKKDSAKVAEINLIPGILLPKEMNLANLRDVAALTQSHLLLVLNSNSDSDFEFSLINDEIIAENAIESFLIDVRTGAIPFTSTTHGRKVFKEKSSDLNNREFMTRARRELEAETLSLLMKDLSQFIKSY
jgi:hypothetical protein